MDYFNDDSSSESISLFSVSIMLCFSEYSSSDSISLFSISIILTTNPQVIISLCFCYRLF